MTSAVDDDNAIDNDDDFHIQHQNKGCWSDEKSDPI